MLPAFENLIPKNSTIQLEVLVIKSLKPLKKIQLESRLIQ